MTDWRSDLNAREPKDADELVEEEVHRILLMAKAGFFEGDANRLERECAWKERQVRWLTWEARGAELVALALAIALMWAIWR